MRFVLAAGTTGTAAIDGLSAAGADPGLRRHTPSADADILVFGRPVRPSVVPVSPTGCPTPAVVTRAARELVGFPVTVLDAGLATPTAVGLDGVGAEPGMDIREPVAVPNARDVAETARKTARSAPDDERVYLAETIPGGTTTAMAVLAALGEPAAVSSSLPANPIERKREVVQTALQASDLGPGAAAGDPYRAIGAVGDPVLATLTGYARGAIETATPLTLAGGTQLLAVAACLRHSGIEATLDVATTSFVEADQSADAAGLAACLDVDLTVTDPGFDAVDHRATQAYVRGEAKEGVGMGGALTVVEDSSRPMSALRERTVALTDELLAATPAGDRS